MKRLMLGMLSVLAWIGCGEVVDVGEAERPPPGPPAVGQLPLELTPELQAAGAQAIANYGGPWTFRRDPQGFLREGDLLQVDVVGVPGLEKRYLEYVNHESLWQPEGLPPFKTRHRTQQTIAQEFPRRARIPPTPGLRIRVFGPYSTDCYYVGGEVRQWGFYPWQEGLTLQQALASAGGPRRNMPNASVHLVRGDRRVTFLLKDVLSGTPRPFWVKPMDEISVLEGHEMKFDARKLGVPPPLPRER
ncbi:MAG: SLBB domain-containing protein [Verrucomicrobiae bacterium]|nr:SLBB domain-containing protein [Verrucomicrobiae bacterium]